MSTPRLRRFLPFPQPLDVSAASGQTACPLDGMPPGIVPHRLLATSERCVARAHCTVCLWLAAALVVTDDRFLRAAGGGGNEYGAGGMGMEGMGGPAGACNMHGTPLPAIPIDVPHHSPGISRLHLLPPTPCPSPHLCPSPTPLAPLPHIHLLPPSTPERSFCLRLACQTALVVTDNLLHAEGYVQVQSGMHLPVVVGGGLLPQAGNDPSSGGVWSLVHGSMSRAPVGMQVRRFVSRSEREVGRQRERGGYLEI